jgi:hypothetical protein
MHAPKGLVAAFALLLLGSLVLASPAKPLVIPEKDFFIGKVTTGATPKEVQAVFGAAKQTQKIPSSPPCNSMSAEEYGGVRAVFCDGRLMKLSCTKKGFKTPSGIEVGLTQKEALKKQGETFIRDTPDGPVARYHAGTQDRILLVHFKDGKVTEIELVFSTM